MRGDLQKQVDLPTSKQLAKPHQTNLKQLSKSFGTKRVECFSPLWHVKPIGLDQISNLLYIIGTYVQS